MKLCKDWNVPVYNCVDLSLLARTVDNARWIGKYNSPLGLARLIESYEYRLMEKGKITRSNWEAHLSKNQQECQFSLLSYFNLVIFLVAVTDGQSIYTQMPVMMLTLGIYYTRDSFQ